MNKFFIRRGAKILNFKGKIDWLGWAAYSRKLDVFGNVRTWERYEKFQFPSYWTSPHDYKSFFMLDSAEHEISMLDKSHLINLLEELSIYRKFHCFLRNP